MPKTNSPRTVSAAMAMNVSVTEAALTEVMRAHPEKSPAEALADLLSKEMRTTGPDSRELSAASRR